MIPENVKLKMQHFHVFFRDNIFMSIFEKLHPYVIFLGMLFTHDFFYFILMLKGW